MGNALTSREVCLTCKASLGCLTGCFRLVMLNHSAYSIRMKTHPTDLRIVEAVFLKTEEDCVTCPRVLDRRVMNHAMPA